MAKKEAGGPVTMGEPATGVKELTADEEIERILAAKKSSSGEAPAAAPAAESETAGA